MKYVYIILLLGFICSLAALPVSANTAQQAATIWTSQWAPASFTDRTVTAVEPLTQSNGALIYVIKYHTGFVLVSADDSCIPIIGYSYESPFTYPADNPAFLDYLTSRMEEVAYVQSQRTDNAATRQEWNTLLAGRQIRDNTRSVTPLLSTLWNQDYPYNALCPTDATGPGGHVYAGCVATAMGQVMKYWNWPETGVGSHAYNAYPYGNQSANFANTTYQWSQMGSYASAGNNSIPTLLYHCAVAVNMDFAPDGSGAQSADAATALRQYFRYNNSLSYVLRSSYSSTAWDALLTAQLDNVHPIYYSGYGSSGGHAFVCDGYQAANYFHFNWGWSGSGNGYFYSNALDSGNGTFNSNQGIIINVHPLNYSISTLKLGLECSGADVGNNIAMRLTTYPILSSWNVTSMQFTIEYDNSTVVYNGFDLVGTKLEGTTVTANENMPGRVTFNVTSTTPVSGSGVLIKPLFMPLDNGTAVFNLADVTLNGTLVSDLTPLLIDVNAPVANVQDSQIRAQNVMNVGYHAVAAVPITTSYLLPHWAVHNLSCTLHYPANKLSFLDVDTQGCLLANGTVTAESETPGSVEITATNASVLSGSGPLFKLRFTAIGNGTATTLAQVGWDEFTYNDIPVTSLAPGNVVLLPITAGEDPVQITTTALLPASPNPFNPRTALSFDLKAAGHTDLTIYNVRGERIKTVVSESKAAGRHTFYWDGTDEHNTPVASGVYYYTLKTADYSSTRKMLLLK